MTVEFGGGHYGLSYDECNALLRWEESFASDEVLHLTIASKGLDCSDERIAKAALPHILREEGLKIIKRLQGSVCITDDYLDRIQIDKEGVLKKRVIKPLVHLYELLKDQGFHVSFIHESYFAHQLYLAILKEEWDKAQNLIRSAHKSFARSWSTLICRKVDIPLDVLEMLFPTKESFHFILDGLYLAIKYGNLSLYHYQIRLGLFPAEKNELASLMRIAPKMNNMAIIRDLYEERGLPLCTATMDDSEMVALNPLYIALRHSNYDAAFYFKEKGAFLTQSQGAELISAAIQDREKLKILVCRFRIKIEKNHLHLAIKYRNIDILKFFLSLCPILDIVDIDLRDLFVIGKDFIFPLFIDYFDRNGIKGNKEESLLRAFAERKMEIIHFLIRNGVDLNYVDSLGKTVLMHAVEHQLGVSLVLEARPDPFLCDLRGRNVFHYACQNFFNPSRIEGIQILLKNFTKKVSRALLTQGHTETSPYMEALKEMNKLPPEEFTIFWEPVLAMFKNVGVDLDLRDVLSLPHKDTSNNPTCSFFIFNAFLDLGAPFNDDIVDLTIQRLPGAVSSLLKKGARLTEEQKRKFKGPRADMIKRVYLTE